MSARTVLTADEVLAAFDKHLAAGTADRGYSEHTRRAYLGQARRYLAWLAEHADEWDTAAVLTDGIVGAQAARAYRGHLMREAKKKPKTVEAALTAIGALYAEVLDLPRPKVPAATGRDHAPQAPPSLTEVETKRLLRAAEVAGVRDHALLTMLFVAGPRVAEAAALDVDDLVLGDDGIGEVEIRYGKGGKYRRVPIASKAHTAVLRRWLTVRVDQYAQPAHTGPLFVAERGGGRLTDRGVRYVVARTAVAAGLTHPVSPHDLRHTFLTRMARAGVDVAVMADLAGHASTETVRRYTRSHAADRLAAVAALDLDY